MRRSGGSDWLLEQARNARTYTNKKHTYKCKRSARHLAGPLNASRTYVARCDVCLLRQARYALQCILMLGSCRGAAMLRACCQSVLCSHMPRNCAMCWPVFCETAASLFPTNARRPVLWCPGIRNQLPWIALSEHTIPECGQVPVAGRCHHPAMFALHMSRSQRAWLRLFFLAVCMLASALSSHVPVTCLQKHSCPGSPCKRPRLGHMPWSGSTGGTHGCVPMRALRRRVQLRRRRARASSFIAVIVLRLDAAQLTGAGDEAPAEVEVPAGLCRP
jgi:hypothetical protein